MKKLFTVVLMCFSVAALADVNTSSTAGSTAGAGAAAVIDSHDNYQGTDVSRAVGVAAAPALATTLTETCMGSTSVGAGFSGGSFSFGTTWRDSACVRRLDARQMSAFGEIPVAVEMMCDSDLVREAAVRAGRPCVADGGAPRGTPVAVVTPEQAVAAPEAAAPVVNQQVRQ